MQITPEQARAELERRAAARASTSQITPEEARAELARRNNAGLRLATDTNELMQNPLGYVVSRGARVFDNFMRQPVADANPAQAFAEEAPGAQMFVQGATFGFGDELTGAASGAGSAAGGGSYSEGYRENTDAAREGIAFNREHAPVTSFVTEMLGGSAVAFPGAKGFVTGATNRVGLAGRSAGVGGAAGGVAGFGEDEGGVVDRLDGAALGAAGGAVIGGGSPLLLEGATRMTAGAQRVVGRAWRNMRNGTELTRAQRRAWDQALRIADEVGVSEDELMRRLRQLDEAGLSEEQTIAELFGEAGVHRARGGVATGDSAALTGRQRMNTRQSQQPERVRGYLDEGLGSDGSDFADTRTQLNQPTPRENELYGEFRSNPAVRRVSIAPDEGREVFHGTPDSRGIREGGFDTARGHTGSTFFTDNRGVAATYADDTRAFDYQNANPEVLQARIRMDRPLVIDAGGTDFRGIEARSVLYALPEEHRGAWSTYADMVGHEGRVRTDDLIDFARFRNFDGLEVRNVRDTYTGDGPRSTVFATFDNAQAALPTPQGDALSGFMQNPRFRRIASQAAQDIFDETGERVSLDDEFSPALIDAIKRRMDRMIDDASGGAAPNTAASRPLRQLRDRWVQFADEAYPNYAPARAEAQVRLSAREALEEGRQIFRTSNVRNPEELARLVEGMTEKQRQAFRVGVARGVVDQMNAAPRNAIEVGGEVVTTSRDASNPISRFWNRADRQEALRAAFGDEAAFRRFVQRMAIEGERADTFRLVSTRTQGSPTQGNQAAAAAASGLDMASDAAEAVGGNPIGVALRRANRLLRGDGANWSPEVESELQKILWSTVPEQRARLLRVLQSRNLISADQARAISAARDASVPVTNAIIQGGGD